MGRFRSFVILAGMRTGSNFLQSNLEALPGVKCLGEAFNPHFIGGPKRTALMGVTLQERDADPLDLLRRMREDADLVGFRYFHDHDPRVFPAVMEDRHCAKIVLSRNPLESYVSLGIARLTNQWRVTNAGSAKRARMIFDKDEFSAHLAQVQDFQTRIRHGLHDNGQTAFYLAYEDVNRIETLNGLAQWLGLACGPSSVDGRLKRQNSAALDEKVANYDEMVAALGALDLPAARALASIEPARGPVVPSYVTAAQAPLMYQPLRGGPERAVRGWMHALDGAAPVSDHNRSSLRKWQQAHPGHRAFTVLRHPLARAHAVFSENAAGPDTPNPKLRALLREQYGAPLPDSGPVEDANRAAAFAIFLQFVTDNLDGRTPIGVNPLWASQSAVITGLAAIRSPDLLIREAQMAQALPALARDLGLTPAPIEGETDPHAAQLARIYSKEMERLCRKAYRRDYESFGFGNWAPGA